MAVFGSLSANYAANAAESSWIKTDFAKIRLISASETKGQSNSLTAALDIWLEEGWKTYWRTPGDAGLAPQIFINQPSTLGLTASLSYPVPKRFELFGIDTFGYGERVILPLSLSWDEQAGDLVLSAMIETLICSDICVPVSGALTLTLPEGETRPSIYAQEIARSLAQVPRIRGADFTLSRNDADTGDLRLQFTEAIALKDIFIEGLEGASFGAPQALDKTSYLIPQTGGKARFATGDAVTATIDAGTEFYESRLSISDGAISDVKTQSKSTSLPIWLIAFLGGLILNLMPCVLPVLSIKISSVLQMAGSTSAQIRWLFMASAGGIITSFGLIALFLQILRQAGHQIGWGIQFQNPVFLGMMAVVMVVFTLSLFDVVHLRTPAFAAKLLSRSSGVVVKDKQSGSLANDFAAGMLATLLATPCSAPFVGTAVSFALAQSDTALYGTLLMMGIGLAAPWLVFALFPSFIGFLPKPGSWMVKVKKGLGILMLGTAIWIISLFVQAAGIVNFAPDKASLTWQSFDEGKLTQLIEDDRVIFVDVTADWCITCKANKALVLDRDETQNMLAASDVVMMQADWTLPDEAISAYLARYNRFGIPFNIIYGPAAKQGIILPEILSVDAIEKAMSQANR